MQKDATYKQNNQEERTIDASNLAEPKDLGKIIQEYSQPVKKQENQKQQETQETIVIGTSAKRVRYVQNLGEVLEQGTTPLAFVNKNELIDVPRIDEETQKKVTEELNYQAQQAQQILLQEVERAQKAMAQEVQQAKIIMAQEVERAQRNKAEEPKEKKDSTTNDSQFNITLKIQEVNPQEIMRLARSQGITGVLRAISDETPNYEEGGNIHQLANAMGIKLYEENQDLEKKAGIPQNLIGNGINDMLLVQNVKIGIEFLEQYIKQNQKPTASGKKLNPEDYQEIAKTYNQTKTPSAIKKISTKHDLNTQQTIDAIIESREYAGVTSIRYTQILEQEITKQDSQFILKTYLENKVEDAKKIINNYLKEYKDMHVNNIYAIIDTASKRVGERKIRKKGKTNQQKQQLIQQIKQYT